MTRGPDAQTFASPLRGWLNQTPGVMAWVAAAVRKIAPQRRTGHAGSGRQFNHQISSTSGSNLTFGTATRCLSH